MEKDDLSLLGGMTEKERKKYNGKGIFTVTQLSHTFRPRRRPKRLCDKPEKYHHALKALAIRERKIHIVGTPEIKIEGTPVYLDVEGVPDQDFYYLIGMRIGSGESAVQHSLWAAGLADEKTIWNQFLDILGSVESPRLIHYGSYETTFLRRMSERYGGPTGNSATAIVIGSAVNLLSVIYAQIYFPTYSNGLKEVARWIGFSWSDTDASGTATIQWRQMWQKSLDPADQRRLITYNAEDCEALEVVLAKVAGLAQEKHQSESCNRDGVVDVTRLKRDHPYGFKRNTFAVPELDAINKAAYWDYQRERIYLKSSKCVKRAVQRRSKIRIALTPNKTVECPRPRCCPKCGSKDFFGHGKARKILIDLKFMRHAIKRWVVQYRFHRYKCNCCRTTFFPEQRNFTRSKFGAGLVAYSLYQNIGLRLPLNSLARSLNKLFGFNLPVDVANRFKAKAAATYQKTYDAILTRLCSGALLHADETKVSLKREDGFVWVFANMDSVAYVYRESREGDVLHDLLKNFRGVLVSDFYAAYGSINCPQQKCLIHLIRDLNDDLLKHPYDEGLRMLVKGFASLVKPMIETVDRFGLKTHFLKKHVLSVDGFYRDLSRMGLDSESALKCKQRLEKNRTELFTFLRHDGVPWNNNNAEHAVKAFATLRNVINGVTSPKGLRDYLVLLSICETCKYQGMEFLDFLRSGEMDIDAFAQKQRKRRIAVSSQLF